MELRHLRGFVAVAEEGSVSRGAARLNLAQPALSRQLQKLERHVGAALFVRQPRGVRLTEAGSRLLPRARNLLEQAGRLAEAATGSADDSTGKLTVGLLDEGAAELTAPIAAAVQSAHPLATVVVKGVAWGPHAEQLRDGRLDAVIGPAYALDRGEFLMTPLFSDGRLAVLPLQHRLAAADVVPTLELLEMQPLAISGVPQAVLDHFLLADLRAG